ncbi:hypothetical protein [Bacillus sp. EAC]|uniref:hypothetical protein n=1 Tax=Bacillus sp. EAC TaxID=1978338 RepID=UPI000B44440A|nr:hypothetical protein [Bacillus sp. EAC]
MKIKQNLFIGMLPILALVAIYLRITHKISLSTFGLMGLIFALIGFIRNQFFINFKTEEKPITDLQVYFNPNKKRYNYFVGIVMFLGIFYLFILIFSILAQF